jgi:hypothetical protein
MNEIDQEIQAASATEGMIDGHRVAHWVDTARSLSTFRLLYELTRDRRADILPALDDQKVCFVIRTFLLECIRLNPRDSDGEWSRYESARVMLAWFYHLHELPTSESNWAPTWLASAAEAVTAAYIAGDEEVRECIETGFLEHALEVDGLQPYFVHWASDPILAPPHARALAYGNAHPYHMRSLFGLLRDAQRRYSK